jgi:hypothetical protein
MMTNNTEKWRGNWSRTREQGVWRYIVLKGLVLFGLILPHFPGHLDMRLNSSIEVFYEEQES